MPHQNHPRHLHDRRADHEVNGALSGRAQQNQVQERDIVSIVSVVYVTAAPTFDGPIGGFTTLGPVVGNPAPSAPAVPVASASQGDLPSTLPTSSASSAQILKSQSASVQVQTIPESRSSQSTPVLKSTAPTSSVTLPSSSSVLKEQATPTVPSTSTSFLVASATESSKTQSTAVPESTPHVMTNGAKAGLALGIILGLGALLVLGLFCYRRKKKQQNEAYQTAPDEKNHFGGHGAALAAAREPSLRSTRTTSTAPRLSLRPVTQFLPEMTTGSSRGKALEVSSLGSNAPEAIGAAKNGTVQNQANNPANPFGNHAETSDHFPQAGPVLGSSPPAAQVPAPLSIRPSTPDLAVLAAGTGLVVGAAGANAAQHRNVPGPNTPRANRHATHAPPYSMESAMPSPVGTEFSMNSVSSGATAAGPRSTNVHRVQLDFMPSMEDEIELRAGQLVRLLHEYDDGWVSLLFSSGHLSELLTACQALCIRLDRSQQGVAPRTCLSTRPVKPRPAGDGRGPLPRGPPPPGIHGSPQQRPASPADGRGSPAPYNRAPRPMSPGPLRGQRSMSPGPYGGGPQQRTNIPPPVARRRSNSAAEVRERRNSPPGPSPMNPNAGIIARLPPQLQPASPPRSPSQSPPQTLARKPVPGQAM